MKICFKTIYIFALVFCILGFSGNAEAVSEGVNVSVEIRSRGPTGTSWSPSQGQMLVVGGLAFPNAFVTVVQDEAVIGTVKANNDGTFSKTFSAIPSGTSNFEVFAEDSQDRVSAPVSFTLDVPQNASATADVFVPPTIHVPSLVHKGDSLLVTGTAFPGSKVLVSIPTPLEIIRDTIAKVDGTWSLNLDTNLLGAGLYLAKAKAVYGEKESAASQSPEFEVVPEDVPLVKNPDQNKDGKVDLVDFSVLLFWWGREQELVDFNVDGIVDIADLSIIMYWWTG
ncbi:MAG: hypothetical protein HYT50_02630 [Candidatus Wildermuthbacteria bacterium]|nr:hypothetical protein [Candidatus Wildermuthbacteria bacterium]